MKKQNIILGFITAVLVTSCYKETFIASGDGLEDWTTVTHSSIAPVNYDVVFPQDKVNRFDIWDINTFFVGLYPPKNI